MHYRHIKYRPLLCVWVNILCDERFSNSTTIISQILFFLTLTSNKNIKCEKYENLFVYLCAEFN